MDTRGIVLTAVLALWFGALAATQQKTVSGDKDWSKPAIAQGYGPDRPVAPSDTEANRAKNRRVEMRVVK